MTEKMDRRIYLKEFRVLSRAIVTYEDLRLLFNHLTKLITTSFKVMGCSIMLLDEREKQFFRMASYGVSQEYLDKGPLFADAKFRVFMEGEPVFIKDVSDDPRVQYPDAALKEGITSILTVPIKFRTTTTGIIRIYSGEKWELHEDDVDSFDVIGEQIGLLLEYNGLKNFFEMVKAGIDRLPPRLLDHS